MLTLVVLQLFPDPWIQAIDLSHICDILVTSCSVCRPVGPLALSGAIGCLATSRARPPGFQFDLVIRQTAGYVVTNAHLYYGLDFLVLCTQT